MATTAVTATAGCMLALARARAGQPLPSGVGARQRCAPSALVACMRCTVGGRPRPRTRAPRLPLTHSQSCSRLKRSCGALAPQPSQPLVFPAFATRSCQGAPASLPALLAQRSFQGALASLSGQVSALLYRRARFAATPSHHCAPSASASHCGLSFLAQAWRLHHSVRKHHTRCKVTAKLHSGPRARSGCITYALRPFWLRVAPSHFLPKF